MKTQQAVKANSKQLLKCMLKIKTRKGQKIIYYGLFQSTMAAVTDAILRFELASISVQKINHKHQQCSQQLSKIRL